MNAESAKPTLRSRVLKAGAWVMGGHVLSQLLRLASNLIMTRMLVPEMFGIMAVANILIVGLVLLSDLGLQQNIIQSRRGNDPVFLNTVWTVQILRGALISMFALGAAYGIYLMDVAGWWSEQSVYAEPILPYVLAVLAANGLINGLESTKLAIANRELAMGRVTRIELISQLAAIVVMILWASLDRSIWALVAGALFGSVLKMVMSHWMLPGEHNRLHWDWEAFWEIFHFGKWIFLSSILGFLATNGDRLILGALTDATNLGLYTIAFFLVGSLREIASKLIHDVAFPALSEVARENRERLKTTYYRFRLPVDVATLLAAGMLFSAGHLLVDVLYDDRYLGAAHMVQILSIALFETRYVLVSQCLMALGKPKLLAPVISIHVVVLFGLMPPAFYMWGLDGALWVAGGSVLFSLPLTFYYKYKFGLFDLWNELKVLPLPLVGYLIGLGISAVASLIGLGTAQ